MPNSTTLESLNIEVNGNAQKASEGIGSLIGSLRSLARGLGTAIPALRSINKELKTLSSFGNLKIPAIGMGVGNGANRVVNETRKVTRATQEQIDAIRKWQQERNAIRPRTFEYHRDNMVSAEEFARVQQQPKTYHVPSENTKRILENSIAGVKGYKETLVSLEHGAKSAIATTQQISGAMQTAATSSSTCASALVGVDKELKAKNVDGKLAKQGLDEASGGMKDVGEAAEDGAKKSGKFGEKLSKISRIFSTMLIRTALRSLMKAFSDSWNAAYTFSQKMGGEFAESIDKVKTLLSGTATNIISAFAPAIQALVPVITAVASAINYLCNLIKSLFSLLGMTSDLFGASTDAINKYAGAASGAGSANKEMLASFDELNVISSASGGGGGGGIGGSSFKFSDLISDELGAVTSLLVGEALLAVGLILACCGHVGIGVGLMAIGAAGIAKVVIEDWGKLSQNVRDEIAGIMTAIGLATLAVGAILAFSGANIPLGIGLMIVGAANLAAAAYVSWSGGISNKVKEQLAELTAIVGGALLGIGAILAFTDANIPLGVGLMVAGAVSLATSAAISWSLTGQISLNVLALMAIVSGALLAVGAVLAFSGGSLPLGIGLMIAGLAGLGASAYLTWGLDAEMQRKVANVTGIVGTALLAVGAILAFTGANLPLGIGLMAVGAASLAASAAITWKLEGDMKTRVAKLTAIVSGALLAVGAVLAFTGVNLPLGIGMMAIGAVGLAASASITSKLTDEVQGKINTITTIVSAAFLALGAILAVTGANIPLGVGLMAVGALTLFGSSFLPWNLSTKVEEKIKNIAKIVAGASLALGAILALTGANIPLGIALMAAGAVGLVSAISPDWGGLVNGVVGAFNWMKDQIISGWEDVKNSLKKVREQLEWISGQHVVELVTKVSTPGTTENNLAKITIDAAKNSGNAALQTVGSLFEWATNLTGKLFNGGSSGGHGFAEGGFPTKGDLFVANEAGAELVGSLNGKTAVANQEQIIEGIQRGVSEANEEQNALLRIQNELLLGILQKETNFNFGASAAFGRVARQSIDMYNNVAGV